ncbi:MAG: ubiquinone/menaquinone biosynthesis methyltransferase [Phycisphaerae bacterium]|jgi:demethylmenaquinone methyltransferase/2-methoxy-6-polyprenyl-1,4-benzoquinol methylase
MNDARTDAANSARTWDAAALRDPHAQADKAARVETMFDAIATTYERVNSVVSLGQDARWRRRAVAAAEVRAGDIVLDVCCGTGSMIRAFADGSPKPRFIVGLDFAANMLRAGVYAKLAAPMALVRGDALRLPLADATVDVVSCAFGVRNFQNLAAGLGEFRRVLRPGGRTVILEFALPENAPIRAVYRFYCERILPILAAWISRDRSGAYKYLPQSIRTFERREAMLDRLCAAGFARVRAVPLNLGGVVIYRGEK